MEIVINKKQEQLGMNPSTASGRLVKDVLYSLIVKTEQNICFICGEAMERDTFSIEHKVPWIDSHDPLGLYFDLENISFSHKSCNYSMARKPEKAPCSVTPRYNKGCRCDDCKEFCRISSSERYTPERRKAQYKRTGK